MPTTIEKLKMAHDELANMTIPAIQSLHMANALVAIEQVIKELEDVKKSEEEKDHE